MYQYASQNTKKVRKSITSTNSTNCIPGQTKIPIQMTRVDYNSDKHMQPRALVYTQGDYAYCGPKHKRSAGSKLGYVSPATIQMAKGAPSQAAIEKFGDQNAKDLLALVRTSEELDSLCQSRFNKEDLVSLLSCKTKPTARQILDLERFTAAEAMRLVGHVGMLSKWDKVVRLDRCRFEFGDIFALLTAKHPPSVEHITRLTRFTAAQALQLTEHMGVLYKWDKIIRLNNCRRSYEDIIALRTQHSPASIEDIIATDAYSIDEIRHYLAIARKIPETLLDSARIAPDEKMAWDEMKALNSIHNKVELAQRAMNHAREILPLPGNQEWSWDEDPGVGYWRGAVHGRMIKRIGVDWMKPRRLSAAVSKSRGGNCQDIASVTYEYLKYQAPQAWTVCYVYNKSVKHVFATIGDPVRDSWNTVVVADAWVKHTRPVTLDKHFCGCAGLEVIKVKRGKGEVVPHDLSAKEGEQYARIRAARIAPVPDDVVGELSRSSQKITKQSLLRDRFMWTNKTPDK